MAVAIFRPRRVSKPPLGVQLDWSNPLTKGLIGAFLLNESGGGTVTDLVAHVTGALSGATLPSWAGANGGESGLTFGGGASLNSYVDAGTGPSTQDLFMDTSHPATILVRVKTGASVINQGFAQRNDNNSSAGWLVGLGTAGQPILEVTQSSVNYKLIATNAVAANTQYDLAFAHNGDQNVAGQLYVNGAVVAQSAGLGGGSRTTSAANPLQFGTSNGNYAELGGNSTVATIYEVLIWNRVLSAAEIAALYASPHQMFRSTQFAGTSTVVPPSVVPVEAGWFDRDRVEFFDGDTFGDAIFDSTLGDAVILSGGSSVSIDAAGTLVLSSSASLSLADAVTAAGAFALTGTASATDRVAITAAGTLPLSGTATATESVQVGASGALVLVGATAITDGVAAIAQGTLALSGSAGVSVPESLTAQGSLVLTGAASLSAPNNVAAVGTLALTGSASVQVRASYAAAGQLVLAGAAAVVETVRIDAVGALVLTGSAAISVPAAGGVLIDAAGSLTMSGGASSTVVAQLAAAGSLALTGAASITVPPLTTRTLDASGTLVLTGAATMTAEDRVAAAGTLTLSGAASIATAAGASASGTLVLRGAAAFALTDRADAAGTLQLTGSSSLTVTPLVSRTMNAAGQLVLAGAATVVVLDRALASGIVALTGHASIVTLIAPTPPSFTILSGAQQVSVPAVAQLVSTAPHATLLVTTPGAHSIIPAVTAAPKLS